MSTFKIVRDLFQAAVVGAVCEMLAYAHERWPELRHNSWGPEDGEGEEEFQMRMQQRIDALRRAPDA